jgi:hypothetical protein
MLARWTRITRLFSKHAAGAESDTFSRKEQQTATDLVRDEILSNPFFEKAFPHLAHYKDQTSNPLEKEELSFIKSLL